MSTLSSRRNASAWGGVWYCQRCHHVEPGSQHLQRRRLWVRDHLRHPRLRQGTGACMCFVYALQGSSSLFMQCDHRGESGNHSPTHMSQQREDDVKLKTLWCPLEGMCHNYVSTVWSAVCLALGCRPSVCLRRHWCSWTHQFKMFTFGFIVFGSSGFTGLAIPLITITIT